MAGPEKLEVLAALRARLAEELAALGAATALARDEATSAESRPENQYDTRALEASYLAAGQGERLGALRRLAAWAEVQAGAPHDEVGPGALVTVRTQGARRWLLIAPRGGFDLRVGAHAVNVVSASSPLGSALQGLSAGDTAEVDAPEGVRAVEVEAVV